jgi:plasmid stability protein
MNAPFLGRSSTPMAWSWTRMDRAYAPLAARIIYQRRTRPALRRKRAPSWDSNGGDMADVLIRDVPDDVIAAMDKRASRLGLSRSEYLRRRLTQDAAVSGSAVTVQDLTRFADAFGDLADPDAMSRSWG